MKTFFFILIGLAFVMLIACIVGKSIRKIERPEPEDPEIINDESLC